MRVFLTGATGFLGNNLCRELLANGHEVIVLCRRKSDPRPLDGLKVQKVFGDLGNETILDELSWTEALSGADALIHSAAIIQLGRTRLDASLRVNRDATRELALQARRMGIRMVHVSTVDALAAAPGPDRLNDESDVDPAKSENTYSISKRAGDEAFLELTREGLDGVIVHPGFMLGPWDWKPSSGEMILALARFPIPFAPAGGFSVADVRDVAGGILSAVQLGRSGERYILAGENMPYFELWQRIAKTISARPPRRKMPDWLARVLGNIGDLGTRLTGRESHLNSAAIQLGQMYHYYTSEKAERELGYRIGSVDDAIADAWDWFVAHDFAKPRR